MICSSEERTDLLLELIVEGCGNAYLELYDSIDASDVTLSKKFQRKMNKIINGDKIEPFKVQFKRIASRVAIVFLVILSLAFSAIMSVSALREAIWNTIVEMYNDYFEITVENEDDAQEVITEIKEVHKPINLPSGIEEEILMNNKRIFMAEYYNVDDCVATFRQTVLDENSTVHLDSETAILSNAIIGNKNVTIIQYPDGYINAFWNDNHYFYTIEGSDIAILEQLILQIK